MSDAELQEELKAMEGESSFRNKSTGELGILMAVIEEIDERIFRKMATLESLKKRVNTLGIRVDDAMIQALTH